LKFRLSDLDAHDRELVALATTKNNIETFIYDIRDKLEHDLKYKQASTSEEQTKINEKLTEIDAWLWDEGIHADIKVNLSSNYSRLSICLVS
jgi:molecular chaperone DnaK (HSP70)